MFDQTFMENINIYLHHKINRTMCRTNLLMLEFRYLQTEDAINANTLIAAKCNDNIDDVISLICETEAPGALMNLESLLILDIQGEYLDFAN